MITFTVVTVCLNAEDDIEKTLKSVLEQQNASYEYIIQDGESCDKTKTIIEQYIPLFKKKNVVLKYHSEKDNGIYDAMNKAVQSADGEWVIFMNAGDLFFDCHVLEDVSRNGIYDAADVIYGHTMVELTKKNYKFVSVHDEKLLNQGMSMGHQAMFVKREILAKYQFDCNYRIAADYDLCLRLFRDNLCFERLNLIVVRYSREGISSREGGILKKECNAIKIKYKLEDKKVSGFMCKVVALIVYAFPFFSDMRYCINQMKRMGVTFQEGI